MYDDKNPYGEREGGRVCTTDLQKCAGGICASTGTASTRGMLLTGKLDEHLKEIGDTAQEMFDRFGEKLRVKNKGVG